MPGERPRGQLLISSCWHITAEPCGGDQVARLAGAAAIGGLVRLAAIVRWQFREPHFLAAADA